MKKLLLSFAVCALIGSSNFAQNLVTNGGFELPDDVATEEISWKEFDIAKKVDAPNITSSTDFSAKAKIGWDDKFIYLNLEVTDDSIYAEGNENTWERDNFEIYFDMNNGKLPLYPRGEASWPSSFDGQPGYWQIRLIPGRTFEELNPSFSGGSQIYHQISNTTTYTYELTLSLDSLLNGFVPEIGKEIGFDILASDNDNDPYYRDQLSIFATLGTIWCDAAMWGTLAFKENGGFEVIDDVTKPSEVTNLAVLPDYNKVLLTWDPATDNIVVEQYIVYVNDEEFARVYAKDTSNSIFVTDITIGEYKFGVAAIDLAGNTSDITSISYTVVGINNSTLSNLTIYPNPSSSVISLNNESKVTMQLFNAAGQLISLKAVDAGEKVDVSELAIGVYTVRVIDNNNISVLKLIKK
jgi:hypothetical protein